MYLIGGIKTSLDTVVLIVTRKRTNDGSDGKMLLSNGPLTTTPTIREHIWEMLLVSKMLGT